jgi:ParB family transcriptional regulator, chromosome partitioning protein
MIEHKSTTEILNSDHSRRVIDITSSDLGATAQSNQTEPASSTSAESILLLDPTTIRATSLPNRDAATFNTDSYYQLKQSILQSGSNLQPIKVRPVRDSSSASNDEGKFRYEVVFGHRRLHACQALGIFVRAVIDEMDDKQVVVERVRENVGRSELCAFDLGRICKRALDDNLFSNQKQLATELGKDISDVSKALALADLPIEVIQAFESPADLQFRHAKALKDALKSSRERVIAVAKEICATGGSRTPAIVLARLLKAEIPLIGPSNRISKTSLIWDGKPFGELHVGRDGRAKISLDRPLDETSCQDLQLHLQEFVKRQIKARSQATQRRNAEQSAKVLP